MLTDLQYRILKRIAPRTLEDQGADVGACKSRLALLGSDFLRTIPGRTVIDFGCGTGAEAIEMARLGAKRVIGIDIRDEILEIARRNALVAHVEDVCSFASSAVERADVVISIDAFEHFGDPAQILRIMDSLLDADGEVLISFGPTWYHPLGGHTFSVFPWAHLVFGEQALVRWRSTFKSDGATRFREVAGGLNQMTIRKFEQLIDGSPFRAASLNLLPIHNLRFAHNRLTREFTTALVRCRLVKCR
jgi:SAM-dependent methyltransferase